jgi:predicted porin
MKRSVFLAALSTLAAGSALAQSNVSVYGRLNETVEYQTVGSTSRSVLVDNDSRIGFKGSEDLGGGLRAFFLIEHGFRADTGGLGTSAFWGRESNVGLQDNTLGTLRLGNMGRTAGYFTVVDAVSLHNHDSGTSKDALYLSPGAATNTVAYTSPSLGGLVVEAQYGVGEGPARHTSVLAGTYGIAGVQLGASYINGETNFTNAGIAGNFLGEEFGVRALYTTGPLTLGGYYIHNRGEATGLKAKRDSLRFAAAYALGQGEVHANLGWAGKSKLNGTSVANSDAKQFTVAYNHNLSKRTKLYGLFTRTFNGDSASYGYPEAPAAITAAGQDVRALGVGIRHNF